MSSIYQNDVNLDDPPSENIDANGLDRRRFLARIGVASVGVGAVAGQSLYV